MILHSVNNVVMLPQVHNIGKSQKKVFVFRNLEIYFGYSESVL